MAPTPEQAATELADTIPFIMRTLVCHMRTHRGADLSVSQFRALAYIHHHEAPSLSQVAEHLDLGLPTTSKLIDGLVARDLVARQPDPQDRRRLILSLTPSGRAGWERARQNTQASLAKLLAGYTEQQRSTVTTAMQILRPTFVAELRAGSRVISKRTSDAAPPSAPPTASPSTGGSAPESAVPPHVDGPRAMPDTQTPSA